MLKFFKDFLIYGLASTLGKLAALFLMPLYTSILTQEEYGVMAMLLSVKGIIDLLSNLNIHSGISRDYYEEGINRKTLVSTGLWSILSLSITIMIFMLVSRAFWTNRFLGIDGYSSSFVLVMLTIPAGSLQSYFAILTRYKKKPVLFSVGTLICLAIQLTIAITSVVRLGWGINGIFLGTFVSELFGICFFSIVNKEYLGLSFNKEYLKRALLFALPTLPAVAAGWIDSSLGQILIGKYVSLYDLGVYSVSLQFASAFTLISTAFGNVWSPYLYENYKTPSFEEQIKKLFILFVSILMLVSMGLSLFSKEIILIFANPNYLKAGEYLTLLCIPMSFYVLFPIAISGISISRDTKYTGIAYVAGSVVNVLMLLITLPYWGVLSVPLSLLLSRITAYSIMYTVTVKKKLYGQLPNGILFLLIGIVLLCLLIIKLSVPLYGRIIVFVVLGALLFFILDKSVGLTVFAKSMINKFTKKNKQ